MNQCLGAQQQLVKSLYRCRSKQRVVFQDGLKLLQSPGQFPGTMKQHGQQRLSPGGMFWGHSRAQQLQHCLQLHLWEGVRVQKVPKLLHRFFQGAFPVPAEGVCQQGIGGISVFAALLEHLISAVLRHLIQFPLLPHSEPGGDVQLLKLFLHQLLAQRVDGGKLHPAQQKQLPLVKGVAGVKLRLLGDGCPNTLLHLGGSGTGEGHHHQLRRV